MNLILNVVRCHNGGASALNTVYQDGTGTCDTFDVLSDSDDRGTSASFMLPTCTYKGLILPCLPARWYAQQERLSMANATCTQRNSEFKPKYDGSGMISLNRSTVAGSLEVNLSNLSKKLVLEEHIR